MRAAVATRDRLPVLAIVAAVIAAFAVWQHARSSISWWWPIGIYGTVFAAIAAASLRGEIAAGSDWLRRVAVFGSSWVRTTELVRVSLITTSTGSRIELRDAAGRSVHARLEELAGTPAVWSAFVAALSVSRATRKVEIDARARRALGISEA